MNQYRGTEKDIHLRIKKLIVGCFRDVVRKIPKTPENLPIIGQLAGSLTSMGANDQEADATSSKKDFIAKYQIVKKETKETIFWLTIIIEIPILPKDLVDPYRREANEILLIVCKIIENSKH